MKVNKAKLKKLILRAAEISEILAETKPLYRELDNITLELIEMEVSIATINGYQIAIVDNFSKDNTMFRVARFKRFDIKIEKQEATLRELGDKLKKKKTSWNFPIKSRK